MELNEVHLKRSRIISEKVKTYRFVHLVLVCMHADIGVGLKKSC